MIAHVQASEPEDVDRAVKAAEKAFQTWQHTTPAERSTALLKLADAIEARADELGRLESRNAGKPVGPRSTRFRWSSTTCASSPARPG